MVWLFIKKCDLISTNITLYYHKSNQHTNPIGGSLTITLIILILASSSYFLYEFFGKISPEAYLLNKYIDDVGIVSTNQKQMFNTLHINKLPELIPIKFDKRALSPVTIVQFNNGTLIAKYYYDYCVFNDDLKGLEEYFPIKDKNVIESTHLCKRYLVDNKGINISSTDPNFYYPIMGHGMSSQSQRSIDFITLVERCTNSTDNGNHCYSETDIDLYYTNILFTFKFIDNYIDISKYETPERRFLNRIEGMLHPSSVGNNYLTFKAISIITHNGLLFDKIEKYNSFKYDYRVESITPSGNDRKVFQINCSLQNMSDVYDRSYMRLQDVAAKIGGIVDFLTIICMVLNYFPDDLQRIIECESAINEKLNLKNKSNNKESVFELKSKDKLMMNNEERLSNNLKNLNKSPNIPPINLAKLKSNNYLKGPNEKNDQGSASNIGVLYRKDNEATCENQKISTILKENYFTYTLRKINPCSKSTNKAFKNTEFYSDLYYQILDFESLVETKLQIDRLSKLFSKELRNVEDDILSSTMLNKMNSGC